MCVFYLQKDLHKLEMPLCIINTLLNKYIINMGGHGSGPEPLIKDPAFEKFYRFRETAGERFRVTPRNLGPIILLTLVIPGAVTWLAYNSQGNYFRGNKRRTEPIHESEYKLRTK